MISPLCYFVTRPDNNLATEKKKLVTVASLAVVPVVPWHHQLFGGTTSYAKFQGVKYAKLGRILKETD